MQTKARNKKGQMAVLIALSFSLLFLLVAMVVNIGFLVTAKINLQNAVDLAAYSGAAQQARYLTEIGKWNYEMRRNYKAMAYDYMIVLNGELTSNATNPDFKNYILNDTNKATPMVCAALQRQGFKTRSSTDKYIPNTLCQQMKPIDMQQAVDAAARGYLQVDASNTAAETSGNPALISGARDALIQTAASQLAVDLSAANLDASMANYEDRPYNYNRRLLAWMFHDYRHLQTRIRGVHFGDISIGKYGLKGKETGRWSLYKNPSFVTIFNNSPMSVAAKVINGYTDLDATEPPPGGGIIPLDDTAIKNPVNNAALSAFKKNLIQVLAPDAKLYHIRPNSPTGTVASSSGKNMAGGCGGADCMEFTGPYLRLNNHDVIIALQYLIVTKAGDRVYNMKVNALDSTTNFPVGVAKDARVKTYYAVVGTASTKGIPFNVFFGDKNDSQDPPLVAVAAARPFGSRIGPYIDDNCEDLTKGSKAACITNGLDPLYPFTEGGADPKTRLANFSIDDSSSNKNLGVKRAVNSTEYNSSTAPIWGVSKYSFLYQIGSDPSSRNRLYIDTTDNTKDDGFEIRPDPLDKNPKDYFDDDDLNGGPLHPQGTKNSVIAWTSVSPNIPSGKRDNYEGYLSAYANMMHPFSQITERVSKKDNQPYQVYVFEYPTIATDKWDIKGKVGGTVMEPSFAATMAVNKFELLRYILPYKSKNDPNSGANTTKTIMNYMGSDQNDKLFGGAKTRDKDPGDDNKTKFSERITPEPDDEFVGRTELAWAETYAAWRSGTRGYRVKLVNIKDLTTSASDFQNKLPSSVTIPDADIKVELSKINY